MFVSLPDRLNIATDIIQMIIETTPPDELGRTAKAKQRIANLEVGLGILTSSTPDGIMLYTQAQKPYRLIKWSGEVIIDRA